VPLRLLSQVIDNSRAVARPRVTLALGGHPVVGTTRDRPARWGNIACARCEYF